MLLPSKLVHDEENACLPVLIMLAYTSHPFFFPSLKSPLDFADYWKEIRLSGLLGPFVSTRCVHTVVNSNGICALRSFFEEQEATP